MVSVKDERISTHTPLARRDEKAYPVAALEVDFYSHASCEARPDLSVGAEWKSDFYSHASCEARPHSFFL